MRQLFLAGALTLLLAARPAARADTLPTATRDDVVQMLANGDRVGAIQRLQLELAAQRDKDSSAAHELGCLLGRAQLIAGQPEAAAATLEAVPLSAACGRRAGFDRADALIAMGDTGGGAALYATLGGVALGPTRDADLATQIRGLADRVDARPTATPTDSIALRGMLLQLAIGDGERTRAALELAERAQESGAARTALTQRGLRNPVRDLLTAAIADQPTDPLVRHRRALAPMLAPADGLALLADLPDTPQTLASRAALLARIDQDAAASAWDALAHAHPDTPSGRDARRLRAHHLASAGRLAEAAPALQATAQDALETPENRANAMQVHAELALADGAQAQAEALLADRVARFPTAADRTGSEQLLAQVRLSRARAAADNGAPADAIALFEAYARQHPTDTNVPAAAYEAGLAARAAGDSANALARWDELMARWPDRQEATLALRAHANVLLDDQQNPEAARIWLRSRTSDAHLGWVASQALDDMASTSVRLTASSRQPVDSPARVSLRTRNATELTLRLHRVDPEAFLRAGGQPASLPDLDVAVIAPDTEWAEAVPVHTAGLEQRFDLDVPLPGPGLFALTVAAGDQEARVVLLSSDVDLVGRVVGQQVAAAVLRDGLPVKRARMLVWSDGRISEGQTDARGLFVHEAMGSTVTVLAIDDGSPALLTMNRNAGVATVPQIQTTVELDRPIYLPGDTLSFRAAASDADAPVQEPWRFWIQDGQARSPEQTLHPTPDGIFVGDLPLSPQPTGRDATRVLERRATLMGAPLSGGAARQLASFAIADEAPPQYQLDAKIFDRTATVSLVDGAGAAIADTPVAWRFTQGEGGQAHTDSRGQVQFPLPPPGLNQAFTASVPGTRLSLHHAPPAPVAPRLQLSLSGPRLRPGAPVVATLSGAEGPTLVQLFSTSPAAETPDAAPDPWRGDTERGLEGPESWIGGAPAADPTAIRATRSVRTVSLGATPSTLSFGDLPPGRYELRATATDGRTQGATAEFTVASDGLHIAAPTAGQPGQPIAAQVSGGPSLLTVEGPAGLLSAQTLVAGEPTTWTPDRRWRGTVTIVATGTDHSVSQPLAIADRLDVDLSVHATPTQWRLDVRTRTADGVPTPAHISLRAIDERLVRTAGPPTRLQSGALARPRYSGGSAGGRATAFSHDAVGEVVAAGLLAEAKRAAEAKREELAAAGMFSANTVQDALRSDVPLELGMSFGGIGTGGGGSGYGGAGYGAGRGQAGTGAGRAAPARHDGVRHQVLWHVVQTDSSGNAQVELPAPPIGARWQVHATAWSNIGSGHHDLEVDTRANLRVAVVSPNPGSPGDTAAPVLRLQHNGPIARKLTITAGEESHSVTLKPGELSTVSLALQTAGSAVSIAVTEAGHAAKTLSWAFPLATGPVDPAGDVLSVHIGRGGGLPLAALGLQSDPLLDRTPGAAALTRAAYQGLAALAAMPSATPADQAALLERATQSRDRVLTGGGLPPDADGAAAWLSLLAQLRDHTTVSDPLLQAAGAWLTSRPLDPQARVASLEARLIAGLPISESTLARLVREAATLPPDESARLARALISLDRAAEAPALVRGDGPQALLAHQALGTATDAHRRALIARGPPPTGDPARAAWLAALAAPPALMAGTAAVHLGDVKIGSVDLAMGGQVTVVLPTGTADGAPTDLRLPDGVSALILRHGAPHGDLPLRAIRVPAAGDASPLAPAGGQSIGSMLNDNRHGCGDAVTPCVLALGDSLAVDAPLFDPGWAPPAGLDWQAQGERTLLRATTVGTMTLRGLRAQTETGARAPAQPITVIVQHTPSAAAQLHPALALAMATQTAAAGLDPGPWLAPWPTFSDWWPAALPNVTRLRFDHARTHAADPKVLVARFEDLRDAWPDANLAFADVASVATAYQDAGQPDRAVDVWRAGLGAAFLAEAAPARMLEDTAGPLASLQAMRAVAARYPTVPVVEEAIFQLPELLGAMADGQISAALADRDITATDLRLMAAAWDREFLALHPQSPRVPEAGFHLAQGLLRLRAWEKAAEQAAQLANNWPDSPLLDRLVYIEALARSERGEDARALSLFERLATESFPRKNAEPGPAALRQDARYAAARLHDARGNRVAAREGYAAVRDRFQDAGRALDALERVVLQADEVVQLGEGDAARLPMLARNVGDVHIRAYRLDLRTVFLRDGGLQAVHDVKVAGVSPAWTGKRSINAGPFPVDTHIQLPLRGPGAWLVELDAGGAQSRALVVRSGLEMDVVDDGATRRVVLRTRKGPAAGAQVRALSDAGAVASRADLRGVALMPMGAPVIAWDGEHIAFSALDDVAKQASWEFNSEELEGDLLQGIDAQLDAQRNRNAEGYRRTFKKQHSASIDASLL